MDVSILGGGLSGLSVSYYLTKNNIKNNVIEINPEIGGLLRTKNIDGYLHDIGGSHILFSKNKKILNEMLSIMDNKVYKIKRNTKIYYKGRYIKYPFENGLSNLSYIENIECTLKYILNMNKIGNKCSNMKEWFYYTFGNGISNKYLVPYNERIWKYPLEYISTNWVERIPKPPRIDIIKSSLGVNNEGYTHQLYFYYPIRGGIQYLANSICSFSNGDIKNYVIKKIYKEENKWIIKSNNHEDIISDKIVSTIPLPELSKIFDNNKDINNIINNNLKYNSLITILIGLNKKIDNQLSWMYIPDKSIMTHRISFPSNFSNNMAPEGKSSILAEITYIDGDEVSKLKDEDIIELTINDLSSMGLFNKTDVTITSIYRHKYAYVIYDMIYKQSIDKIYNYFDDIYLTGRFSKWEYINMDRVMQEANEISQKVLL